MKANLFSIDGKKKGEVEMPKMFEQRIREDIVLKCLEAEKEKHQYSPSPTAGRRHSASGIISHQRHKWKGHYGKGISRIPRKIMWRRGTQFHWIGAEVTGTRGGRKAHAPELVAAVKGMNRKERKLAIASAFAATTNELYVSKRYSRINDFGIKLPLVLESKSDKLSTKVIISGLKVILGDVFSLALKKKEVRAGKGKSRNRRYKSNAGLLLVKGSDEALKMKGIDVKSVKEIKIADLYPLGRLTIYTEKALHELGGKK